MRQHVPHTCTPKKSSLGCLFRSAHSEACPCNRLVASAISPQVMSAPSCLQMRLQWCKCRQQYLRVLSMYSRRSLKSLQAAHRQEIMDTRCQQVVPTCRADCRRWSGVKGRACHGSLCAASPQASAAPPCQQHEPGSQNDMPHSQFKVSTVTSSTVLFDVHIISSLRTLGYRSVYGKYLSNS